MRQRKSVPPWRDLSCLHTRFKRPFAAVCVTTPSQSFAGTIFWRIFALRYSNWLSRRRQVGADAANPADDRFIDIWCNPINKPCRTTNQSGTCDKFRLPPWIIARATACSGLSVLRASFHNKLSFSHNGRAAAYDLLAPHASYVHDSSCDRCASGKTSAIKRYLAVISSDDAMARSFELAGYRCWSLPTCLVSINTLHQQRTNKLRRHREKVHRGDKQATFFGSVDDLERLRSSLNRHG